MSKPAVVTAYRIRINSVGPALVAALSRVERAAIERFSHAFPATAGDERQPYNGRQTYHL